MRWPIQRFSGGRLRMRATRSWCSSSLKNERLLQTTIEERNAVMHRGPHRGHAHAEVAVAANCDRQPARALERQCGADGDAGSAADAAAALGADVVERMAEWPGGAVPGQRQMGERRRRARRPRLQRRARDHRPGAVPLDGLVAFGLRLHRRGLCDLLPPSAARSCGTAASGVVGSSRSTGGRIS